VFLVAIVALPLSGYIIDRIGYNLYWLILSSIGVLATHSIFEFTFLTPVVGCILLGLSYSVLSATFWSTIPKVIETKYLATAFGL
jgi:hypothetical protein